MLAAAAALALAFWVPYNGGAPLADQSGRVCTPADVHVYDQPPAGAEDLPADALAFAFMADASGQPLPPHCDVYVSRGVIRTGDAAFICDVIAHEYGHAVKLLQHSDDPRNVMFPTTDQDHVPAACKPPRRIRTRSVKLRPDRAPVSARRP